MLRAPQREWAPGGGFTREIEELRTMTRVTRLRRRIECRQDGAWLLVGTAQEPSLGPRKVTSYGRSSRSFVRSVTSEVGFPDFHPPVPGGDSFLVEFPPEADEESDVPGDGVEITEVTDDPPEPMPAPRKASVVTLGKSNVVQIGPRTGPDEGTADRKARRVGFCKTEVHFTPDTGRFNIVETDEKPPPTQIFRRRKKQSRGLPKTYFGDAPAPLAIEAPRKVRADSPRPVPAERNLKFTAGEIKRSVGNINNYLANRKELNLTIGPIKFPVEVKAEGMGYLGSVSPKLQSLIQNSHLRPLRMKEENAGMKQTTVSIKVSPDPEITIISRKSTVVRRESLQRKESSPVYARTTQKLKIQSMKEVLEDEKKTKAERRITIEGVREVSDSDKDSLQKTRNSPSATQQSRKVRGGRTTDSTKTTLQSGKKPRSGQQKITVQSVKEVLESDKGTLSGGKKTKGERPVPQQRIMVQSVKEVLSNGDKNSLHNVKKVKGGHSTMETKKEVVHQQRIESRMSVKQGRATPDIVACGKVGTTPTRPARARPEPSQKTQRSASPLNRTESSTTTTNSSATRIRRSKEPLKSFEKVSNGWVGITRTRRPSLKTPTPPVPAPRTSITVNKTGASNAGTARRTSTISTVSAAAGTEGRSTAHRGKPCGGSRENLKSVSLVMREQNTRLRIPPSTSRGKVSSRTWPPVSERRDSENSDDSLVRADREVTHYMFNRIKR